MNIIPHSFQFWFLTKWIRLKLWWRKHFKRESGYVTSTSSEPRKIQMAMPKPSVQSVRSRPRKHLLHHAHSGTFSPMKSLYVNGRRYRVVARKVTAKQLREIYA